MRNSVPPPPALASAVRKVKWRVLPLLVVMFVVNYVDRVNVSFIREQLQGDLGLNAEAFGHGAGLFFIGYALLEIPSNLALQRVGARRWLGLIALVWGLVAAGVAFVHTKEGFYLLRFLLGAAEAGFFPGVVYYLACWLPAAERGKAMAVFLSGSAIGSIIAGPLSGCLLQLGGLGMKGWQWMTFLEGIFSILLAGVAWHRLDSHRGEARWLNPEEKAALEGALEDASKPANATRRASLAELVGDWQIALFCVIYFAIQLTIYAATFWLPSIIRAMGSLSDMQVGWLNSIPWLISILGMYLAAAGARRWRHPQAWVAGALLIAAVNMLLATTGSPVFAYGAICCAALGFKSAASLFWPIPQGYLDPRIAAGAIALINSLGNLGGYVAPATFGWLQEHTGSIERGLYALSFTSAVAAGLVFLLKTKPEPQPNR